MMADSHECITILFGEIISMHTQNCIHTSTRYLLTHSALQASACEQTHTQINVDTPKQYVHMCMLARRRSLTRSLAPPGETVGFTELASSMSSAELIVLLNDLFTAFDQLAIKHGVYKVESMGDAYMIASGHDTESSTDHHMRVYNAARDMLKATNDIKATYNNAAIQIR